MENFQKHRSIKLVNNDKRNYLVPEPNYNLTKWSSEKSIPIKTKKVQVKINQPVYLWFSILH